MIVSIYVDLVREINLMLSLETNLNHIRYIFLNYSILCTELLQVTCKILYFFNIVFCL